MVKTKMLAVATTVVTALSTAYAGNKAVSPVTIDLTAKTASGAMGTARNSADSYQYIGCYTFAYAATTRYGGCVARDSALKYVTCTAVWDVGAEQDRAMIEAMASVTGDSHVKFTWDSHGWCTYVRVENNSRFAPKEL